MSEDVCKKTEVHIARHNKRAKVRHGASQQISSGVAHHPSCQLKLRYRMEAYFRLTPPLHYPSPHSTRPTAPRFVIWKSEQNSVREEGGHAKLLMNKAGTS